MTTKWLVSLLRARQLQEDAAKLDLAVAQRRARSARDRIRYDEQRLESLVAAEAQDSAPAFVAAAVALQAAAATHSASIRMAEHAAAVAVDRTDDLGEAARARRTAEELNERVSAAERRRALLAQQRELDEVAARVAREGRLGS
jgi:hypothetical protein